MGHYRFLRSMRLLKTDDFSSVFNLRISVSNEWFQLLGRRNDQPGARIGLVVGKKTAKQAVARNYMKRTIRETFRLHHAQLEGLDVVVRVRQRFGRAEGAAARAALLQLFSRLPKKCRASASR
ncbi:ribonuclease P protein component [Chitinilyticum piscinae]|uniref:Ribonuclease P protein component n=1 Tax=Chitinilyticum piscinae TaxID=2866724 RepID=A0A8J7FY28_9NEIS|nr:ribonuclease P protein component [Chitinilyticum piscinae]MBE9607793.1 ribonuclease P protein component [Chitinilyticum piscinae]